MLKLLLRSKVNKAKYQLRVQTVEKNLKAMWKLSFYEKK